MGFFDDKCPVCGSTNLGINYVCLNSQCPDVIKAKADREKDYRLYIENLKKRPNPSKVCVKCAYCLKFYKEYDLDGFVSKKSTYFCKVSFNVDMITGDTTNMLCKEANDGDCKKFEEK